MSIYHFTVLLYFFALLEKLWKKIYFPRKVTLHRQIYDTYSHLLNDCQFQFELVPGIIQLIQYEIVYANRRHN